MKKIMIGLLIVVSLNTFSNPATPSHSLTTEYNTDADKQQAPQSCKNWPQLLKPLCRRINQVWTEGNNELYLSGYAWHNRITYGDELLRKKKYNEHAWGGGLGKGLFDENGNWHGLYAIAFLDSHSNVEPAVGYAHLRVAQLRKDFKIGVGFSILFTARPDILNNFPFPGVVPWAGVFIGNLSLKAAYIPGSTTNGNVLYLVGTYSFDL